MKVVSSKPCNLDRGTAARYSKKKERKLKYNILIFFNDGFNVAARIGLRELGALLELYRLM